MTNSEIEEIRTEFMAIYPGRRVEVTDEKREMVVEISDGFAVAVIERSLPHFHLKMKEVYRVLRGTLYVSCAGQGHVLRKGDTITIKPKQVHLARGADKPAWVEVISEPP